MTNKMNIKDDENLKKLINEGKEYLIFICICILISFINFLFIAIAC